MTFRLRYRSDLPGGVSPFRVMDDQGREIEWANRFLDAQRVRGLQTLSLRTYGHALLHFIRWWSRQPGVDVRQFTLDQFTESTLVDYVRDQLNRLHKPAAENVNFRSILLRRLFRFHFQDEMPHSPYRLQSYYWRRSPLGYGRRRRASADLHVKVPQRVIVPLSPEQVEHFWRSFRTVRDVVMVAFMLFNGLRSREVTSMQLEDLLLSEAQVRVRGKGGRVRLLPLPPETIRLLQVYLRNERPLTNAPQVFVSLKGQARGRALTPAGLRSLFRHHRAASGVTQANPHRFRHTFASDMIRAGISLPALQRLMGHAHIHTTMIYIHLSAQDVFAEYARAVARLERKPPS
jgi:site-specific recombinase XerD